MSDAMADEIDARAQLSDVSVLKMMERNRNTALGGAADLARLQVLRGNNETDMRPPVASDATCHVFVSACMGAGGRMSHCCHAHERI